MVAPRCVETVRQDADGPAVRLFQRAQNLVECHGDAPGEIVDDERPRQVLRAEPERRDAEFGRRRPLPRRKGIDGGHQMSAHAVGVDEGRDADRLD